MGQVESKEVNALKTPNHPLGDDRGLSIKRASKQHQNSN